MLEFLDPFAADPPSFVPLTDLVSIEKQVSHSQSILLRLDALTLELPVSYPVSSLIEVLKAVTAHAG